MLRLLSTLWDPGLPHVGERNSPGTTFCSWVSLPALTPDPGRAWAPLVYSLFFGLDISELEEQSKELTLRARLRTMMGVSRTGTKLLKIGRDAQRDLTWGEWAESSCELSQVGKLRPRG